MYVHVESWVDVQEGEGKLVHNRSKEELEKLLASAVSEEEPEMSDSETMYVCTYMYKHIQRIECLFTTCRPVLFVVRFVVSYLATFRRNLVSYYF